MGFLDRGVQHGAPFYQLGQNLKTLDRVLQARYYRGCGVHRDFLFAEKSIAIQWAVFGTLICTCLVCYFAYAAMSQKFAWRSNVLSGLGVELRWCRRVCINGDRQYALQYDHGQLPSDRHRLSADFHSFALADRIKVAQKQALDANELAVRHLQRYQSLFDNAVEGLSDFHVPAIYRIQSRNGPDYGLQQS